MVREDLSGIRPLTKADLTKYFDKVDVDLKADLSDWHKVRKELRRKQENSNSLLL